MVWRASLDRGVRIVATVIGALAWVQSALTVAAEHPTTLRDAKIVTLIALGLALALAVRDVFANRQGAGLAIFAVLCGVALLLLPAIGSRSLGVGGAPPLMHVAVTGLLAGLAVLPMRAHGFAAAILGIGSFMVNLGADGPLIALAEAGLFVVVGLTCSVMLRLLDRTATEVDDANGAIWQAEEVRARARRWALESERWDALIHDKVLGALLLAIRGNREPARSLATEALDAMHGDREGDGFVREVRAAAERLGLQVDLMVAGSEAALDDVDVRAAISSGTVDALTNVARHSGAHDVVVRATFEPDAALVEVVDQGRGFDPGQVDPRRFGLRSIEQRLDRLGGTARVDSTPGAGSTVTLEWRAQLHVDVAGAGWNLRAFRRMASLGFTAMAFHLALGATQLHVVHSPGVVIAGMVAIGVASVVAGLAPPRRRWLVPLIPLLFLTSTVLAANLVAPAPLDWRYWFVGAQDAAAGLSAFRRSWRFAALAAAASVAGMVLGCHRAGVLDAVLLLTVAPQLVLCIVAGTLLRAAIDAAARASEKSSREAGMTRLVVAEEQERNRVARARTATLKRLASPLLSRLAVGSDMPDELTLRVVEASLRDHLLAPQVVTPALGAALRDARRRGVQVELALHGEPPHPADARSFARTLAWLLEHARPGHRLVALCGRKADGVVGTIALLGTLETTFPEHTPTPGYRCTISGDDDATLVVLGI